MSFSCLGLGTHKIHSAEKFQVFLSIETFYNSGIFFFLADDLFSYKKICLGNEKKQNQQPDMVILLQFFKFTSVVYSIPTFCKAYIHIFSVHNKLKTPLSETLLTVGLPDCSCTTSLVKPHRDETETLNPPSMLAMPQGSWTGFVARF